MMPDVKANPGSYATASALAALSNLGADRNLAARPPPLLRPGSLCARQPTSPWTRWGGRPLERLTRTSTPVGVVSNRG
jgi:hypothetical protein